MFRRGFTAKNSKKLVKFKNNCKGKRCFIIGNGPSLKIEDLDTLHKYKEYTFASNRIYLAFDKTVWRPDFYVLSDPLVLANNYLAIKKIKTKKFISDKAYLRTGLKPYAHSFILKCASNLNYPYFSDFSRDITKYISDSYTVVYNTLQIAVYMGFNEIYLLGMDHSYKIQQGVNSVKEDKNQKDFFIDSYGNQNRTLPRLYICEKDFMKADTYSKYNGFRIYNATRGGYLEVFERAEFNQLFD